MARTDRLVSFVGCGATQLTASVKVTREELAAAACQAAICDAGLEVADIDGLNVQGHHEPHPSLKKVTELLQLKKVNWARAGGIGAMGAAVAAQALDRSECRYVVVCKVMDTVAPVTTPAIDPETGLVGGALQFEVPYGLGYTMQRVGLTKRRWMHTYGVTHEQVGWLAVTLREYAVANPNAIFRTPLTLDDYLASRWIADPIRLLDCDRPVNGAYAYVLTTEPRARMLAHPQIQLVSWAEWPPHAKDFHLRPAEESDGPDPWLVDLYRDAKVEPVHMDLWMLYDGFSHLPMQWMESLGLVKRGGSGELVSGGAQIRRDGEHPTNTHGGNLSEGRMHGAGHFIEAVRQLRGAAGPRQVKKSLEHAVVTTAFPNKGAAAILRRV